MPFGSCCMIRVFVACADIFKGGKKCSWLASARRPSASSVVVLFFDGVRLKVI